MIKKLHFNPAPYMSVLIIIFTLLSIVILKLEVRRQGYALLKLNRVESQLREENRNYALSYSKSTNPTRLRRLAETKLTLTPAHSNQILQMVGQHVARQ